MNIALLTFYSPHYQKVADLVIPNREEYCKKHGYAHEVFVGPYFDGNLYYAIDRLIYTYDYLFKENNDIQAIWVLNIQSVITNQNKKIEDLLDNKHDFYVSRDVGGENMGSFIIKKSDWSEKYLKFLCSESPKNPTAHWGNHWEQAVVQKNMNNLQFKDKIKSLQQNDLNSYDYVLYPPWNENTNGHWKEGDLAVSFPGTTIEKRLEIIPKWLKKVKE